VKVSDIMTKNVITVKPDTPLHALAELFVKKGVSGAPVVDDKGKVLGVALEEGLILRDKKVHLPTFIYILNGFIELGAGKFDEEMRKVSAINASGIMETNFASVTPDTPIEEVATGIIEKGLHYFIVLDKGELAGVLTRKDVVKAIAKETV
jgi:CBS domain-containing protein